jgi:hypothetical protein
MESPVEEDLYGSTGALHDRDFAQKYEALIQSPYSATFAWRFCLLAIEACDSVPFEAFVLPETPRTCVLAPVRSLAESRVRLIGNGLYEWTPLEIGSSPTLSIGVDELLSFTKEGFDLQRPFQLLQTDHHYKLTQESRILFFERNRKSLLLAFSNLSFRVTKRDDA